jgi:hypothetical protein
MLSVLRVVVSLSKPVKADVQWKSGLYFDEDAFLKKVDERCTAMLDRMENLILNYMKYEYAKSSRGNGDVPSEWVRYLHDHIGEIQKERTESSDSLEFMRKFGLAGGQPLYQKVRASVVEHGTSRTGSKLWTKPGTKTWHASYENEANHLRILRTSHAKSAHPLPDSWNHLGTHIFNNAMRLVKKHWKRDLEALEKNILKDLISCMVVVKK